jgi:hypothetical protein
MVVSLIALVLAVTGTAVAAIGDNSVGAEQLGPVKQRSKVVEVPVDETARAVAKCRRGEQLLGGGATLPGADPAEHPSVEQSGPAGKRKWVAIGNNDDSVLTANLRATAICLKK